VKCTHTLHATTGVKVTPEDVSEKILSGLGSNDGYMDMMQLVSLLLIPVLREDQVRRQQDVRMENGDPDFLAYALEMMLHDVTGSRAPKRLTRTLIKQILQAYGETALSEDDGLVQQMLEQAGASSSQDRVLLNLTSFCRALTSDVQGFDVGNKDKLSTNFDDVLFSDVQEYAEPEMLVPTVFNKNTTVKGVDLKYTAPQVDNVADTYRSKPLIVFMWAFFVLSFQTYLSEYINSDILGKCPSYAPSKLANNVGSFLCTMAFSIFSWIIIMLLMSFFGLLYFWLVGMGNFVECNKPIYPLVGMVFAFLYTLLPWLFMGQETPAPTLGEHVDAAQKFLETTTFILGGFTILFCTWQFISCFIPESGHLRERFQWILIPEAIRTESRAKQAGTRKINNLVLNALEVHRVKKQESVVPTHFGQALLNFAEMTPEFVEAGGFGWTWRMICSRDLFRVEGLFFSGRLLSSNFAQFALIPFILIGGIMATRSVSQEADGGASSAEQFLRDHLNVVVDLSDEVASFQKAMAAALATGTSIAFLTALSIAVMVLPSASTTAMKFRSGVIPFVNDTRVKMLRIAPDQTASLRGFMFWGTLYASIVMGGLVGKC